jgi:hypothetical protein
MRALMLLAAFALVAAPIVTAPTALLTRTA